MPACWSLRGKRITERPPGMQFEVITLFPELVQQVLQWGINERAVNRGLLAMRTWNPRDYVSDVHRTVDDRPYGGGPGMVLMFEPLERALLDAQAAESAAAPVVCLSPQGPPLTQSKVNALAGLERVILVSGRYEGIDQRFIDTYVDEECSLGDYVLSGGELPAMVLMDAVIRQLPGALGHQDSAKQDSFMTGLLDCPHYTRPEMIRGQAVPEVLLSGHHAEIDRWRRHQALRKTLAIRPDLLRSARLTEEDKSYLATLEPDAERAQLEPAISGKGRKK